MPNDAHHGAGALLTPQQAAHLLNVDESTIRRWIRKDEMKAVKTGPHKNSGVRIPFTSLVGRLEPIDPERQETP